MLQDGATTIADSKDDEEQTQMHMKDKTTIFSNPTTGFQVPLQMMERKANGTALQACGYSEGDMEN